VVEEAFNSYMDHMVDRLGGLGIEEALAMDAIFSVVEQLGEDGVLPPYPEGQVGYEEMGTWLVAAADFGLVDFMVEAAQA
jgi:hypothetical protein